MSNLLTGTAYLTVRRSPRFANGIQAVKVTGKKPTVIEADDVVVKVGIVVPAEAFRPLDGGVVEVSTEDLVRAPYLEALQS